MPRGSCGFTLRIPTQKRIPKGRKSNMESLLRTSGIIRNLMRLNKWPSRFEAATCSRFGSIPECAENTGFNLPYSGGSEPNSKNHSIGQFAGHSTP